MNKNKFQAYNGRFTSTMIKFIEMKCKIKKKLVPTSITQTQTSNTKVSFDSEKLNSSVKSSRPEKKAIKNYIIVKNRDDKMRTSSINE